MCKHIKNDTRMIVQVCASEFCNIFFNILQINFSSAKKNTSKQKERIFKSIYVTAWENNCVVEWLMWKTILYMIELFIYSGPGPNRVII